MGRAEERILLTALAGVVFFIGGCYSAIGSFERSKAKYRTERSTVCTLGSGQGVSVRNPYGWTTIAPDDAASCQIMANIYVRAPTEKEAQEIGDQVQIASRTKGETLYIGVDRPPLKSNRSVWVEFRILVPAKTNVVCRSDFGDITCENTQGPLRLETGYGRITCREIGADQVVARSSYGPIAISCSDSCPADMTADVDTGHGDVHFTAPACYQGIVELATGHGSVTSRQALTIEKVTWGATLMIKGEVPFREEVKKRTVGDGHGRLYLHSDYGSVALE